jgi:site-specific DNA-methyltransferase (adenine-specific)
MEKGFFFDNGQTRIINEDIFTTKKIAAGSIDLLITSPPYNVDVQYATHDDRLTYKEYRDFSRRWMKRCFTWLKDDGRFCLNITLDKNKGRQ